MRNQSFHFFKTFKTAVPLHRPSSGQGLKEAGKVIFGMRSVTDELDFFNAKRLDHIIVGKEMNQAYCCGIEKKEYLFYFTNGGSIGINISVPGVRNPNSRQARISGCQLPGKGIGWHSFDEVIRN